MRQRGPQLRIEDRSRRTRRVPLPVQVVAALAVVSVVASACSSSSPTAKADKAKSTIATVAVTTTSTVSTSTTAPGAKTGAKTTTTIKTAGTGPCSSSTPGGLLKTSCDTQTTAQTVTGAGANSAAPFLDRVVYYFNQADKGVSVNYSPAGSSVGVTDIEQNTVQFGQSEVPVATPASGSGGAIVQIPIDLGGVALSYNVPGVPTGLKLDGPTLAGIYLGSITTWNNSAITALNPGVNLPSSTIVAVHRADSSGPGYDLDQYLIDTGGSAWTNKAGTSASTHWPVANVGVGEQLNTGVASYVEQTQGAIGFVEYAYALEANFTNAALLNRSGAYVAPSSSGIAAAGSNASNVSASNFNIVNGPGASTYPLANFSWTLLYQKQANSNLGIVLGKLFDWITTTGQQQAAALGYSPLPSNIVALAHNTLIQLEGPNGQPLFSN